MGKIKYKEIIFEKIRKEKMNIDSTPQQKFFIMLRKALMTFPGIDVLMKMRIVEDVKGLNSLLHMNPLMLSAAWLLYINNTNGVSKEILDKFIENYGDVLGVKDESKTKEDLLRYYTKLHMHFHNV